MPSRSLRGPFRPGTGAAPPWLAGRESEQSLFREFLADLKQGIAPGTQVVLHGPRGNGKTALLGWLEREAAAIGVETLILHPAEIPDAGRLSELLAPRSWWGKVASGQVEIAGFSWKSGAQPPPPASDVLAARARSRPLVVLVDEAHTLEPRAGRALLNAAQEAGAKLPCLLALAGTPNLEARLGAMQASFWNRAELLRIGRLNEAATADALRRPLADEGFPVDSAALNAMVRNAQGYPWFVQLLGRAVWTRAAASDGTPAVTTEIVDAALPDFERTKRRFYRQRLDELRGESLLAAARAVADAFRGRATLTDPQLDAALQPLTHSEIQAAAEALAQLGFLWRVDDRLEWEPGIPSLMDYTRDVAPAP